MDKNIEVKDFVRLTNNFYNATNIGADTQRIATDLQLFNYVAEHSKELGKKYKIAFTFICLNPLYWQFVSEMVEGARQFFAPGHETDFFFWTDIPEKREDIIKGYSDGLVKIGLDVSKVDIMAAPIQIMGRNVVVDTPKILNDIIGLRSQKDIHIIPTEPIEWPFPTLMRYHTFLQQEEILKDYDYIFYCDVDMKFVNIVGDEIFGEGLTAAQHPMYAHRKEYWPPYEPNPESAAYINRPGKVINENGKPRFMPLYYAGGFQGGKSAEWISAMKEMRKMVDHDLGMNYIPIWNDESVWQKYLFNNPPANVLTPSYIMPDSLIKEYYEPLWGKSYQPKLMTLTKWFSLSAEGGAHAAQMAQDLKALQR